MVHDLIPSQEQEYDNSDHQIKIPTTIFPEGASWVKKGVTGTL